MSQVNRQQLIVNYLKNPYNIHPPPQESLELLQSMPAKSPNRFRVKRIGTPTKNRSNKCEFNGTISHYLYKTNPQFRYQQQQWKSELQTCLRSSKVYQQLTLPIAKPYVTPTQTPQVVISKKSKTTTPRIQPILEFKHLKIDLKQYIILISNIIFSTLKYIIYKMNKYTLNFADKVLENDYEEKKTQRLLQPVYRFITFASIAYLVAKSTSEIIQQVYVSAAIKLSASVFGVIIYYMTRDKSNLIVYSASVGNIILVLFQGTMKLNNPAALAYCFGANMMLPQCILMISYKFKYGIVHNIFMLIGRTIITYFQAQNAGAEVYVVNFLTFVFLGIILYKLDYTMREVYQLTIKDHSYDQIVPLIINKPFVVFQYDSYALQYTIVHGNMTQQELVQLIRQYNYNNAPFESYIQDQFKESQMFKNMRNSSLSKIELFNKSKKVSIQYAEIYIPNLQYLIIINNNEEHNFKKEQYCNQLVNNFHIYQHHLIQSLKCALQQASFKKVTETLMILQETYYHQYLYLNHQLHGFTDIKIAYFKILSLDQIKKQS